jgi:hypothetical protein
MNGKWTVTRKTIAPIHTFTAPEEGWLVTSHIIELTPVPKPFLMIIDWVRTPEGWRTATDIALPIPPAPPT